MGDRAPVHITIGGTCRANTLPPSWIKSFTRLRDLKRELARAELTIRPFVLL